MRTRHDVATAAEYAIVLGALTAPSFAVTVTPTSDTRETSASTTSICEGTTTILDAPLLYAPFQSLSQTEQECDGGATSVMAGSIQQSQLYPGGIFAWCVVAHQGAGAAGVEASATSLIEIEFETDTAARFFVGSILESNGGLPGSLVGTIELSHTTGEVLETRDVTSTGGPYLQEQFYTSLILEADTYVYRVIAEADSGGALTSLPYGEIDLSAYVDIQKIGDLTGDGSVGFQDLSDLLAEWGACPGSFGCYSDLDGDGSVGFLDLSLLLANWGT